MTYAVSSTAARTSASPSSAISVSKDGRFIAYIDQAGKSPSVVKILDTRTGLTRSLGDEVDAARKLMPMTEVKIAGDGQSVVFTLSDYTTTNVSIIAHVNLRTGELRYVSGPPADAAPNGGSRHASVSDDGRYVAFQSESTNLVAGDTNGRTDVFVKDMLTGSLRRVSTDGAGAQLSLNSDSATLSGDGKSVLFNTTVVGPEPGMSVAASVMVKNLDTGAVKVAGVEPGGTLTAHYTGLDLSADGRYALLLKGGGLAGSGAELLRQDLLTNQIVSVSAPAGGLRYTPTTGALSDDGARVLFNSVAEIANTPLGTVPSAELYVRDMASGAVSQVSVDSGNGWGTDLASLSGDGADVVYTGKAHLPSAAHLPTTPQLISLAKVRADGASTGSGTGERDTFLPHAGNQVFDGAAALDTAVYRGKMADYTVRVGASGALYVTDSQPGRDGADEMGNVERLRFSDGALAFDVYSNAGQAYRIYQAAFDRMPDSAGLGYWIDRLDGGDTLNTISAQFVASGEFTALYGRAPTSAQLVNQLYQNVLHRAGDAGGVAYWNEILDQKKATAAGVLASFSESPENVAALIGVMDDGIAYTYHHPAGYLTI